MNDKSANVNKSKYQLVEKVEATNKVNAKVVARDDEEDDDDESEEVMIPEFDQISILAASRVSLRKRESIHSNLKEKNNTEADKNLENKKPITGFKSFLLSYRGSLLGLLNAFIQSLMVTLVKKTELLSASEAVLVRYALAFVIMFTISRYKEISPLGPDQHRYILLLRGFLGAIGLSCALFALTFINVRIFFKQF